MTRLAILFVAVLAFCPIALMQGCAGSQRTTTVTTRTDGGAVATQSTETPGDTSPTQSTTTTTTESNEPDSVLGATAHAIGTIILFPFRLIGDALGLIF
jgi:hypothetical protein